MLKYKKFQLITDLRAVKGIEFIKFNLKKIELAKEIFLKELENGQDVFIPSEMSQEKLPLSMKFYDPILMYCQSNMSVD